MATFEELRVGGIRGLLPKNDPAAPLADKILAFCTVAQLTLDQCISSPADLYDSTLATLDSWQAALLLAQQAMQGAYSLVQANRGVVEVSVDGLTVTHERRVFTEPPTKEQTSYVRVRK